MTEKMNVIGGNAHSFFEWAKENHGTSAIPKWNFHKIIIGKDGKVADTFSSITKPSSKKFISLIEKEIKIDTEAWVVEIEDKKGRNFFEKV